jgi:hypothetical protein
MADRDRFDLDLSPGEQPPTGLGDRVLVVIAALVLLSGLAIAVLHALPQEDQTARASATPRPSPSPTPQLFATPAPPRVATVVPPDIEMVQPSQQPNFSGWIKALTDIDIRSGPEPQASTIGILPKGEIAYADQQVEPATEPGWLFLQAQSGWIASVVDGHSLVHRYEYPTSRGSGWLNSIKAGSTGLVALVSPPSGPYEQSSLVAAVSTNGSNWAYASSSAFGGWYVDSVAWGPAGWLAAAYVYNDSESRIWLWSSPDGLRWTRLGMFAGATQGYPGTLVASADRYLFETGGDRASGYTLWSSTDGRTWTEVTDHTVGIGNNNGEQHIQALAGGFYLWNSGGSPVAFGSPAAFSIEGLRWTRVVGGPQGQLAQLTTLGDRVLATDLDPVTQSTRVWSGSIVRGQLLWRRVMSADPAFAGGVVTQLVSDGRQAYAFGWDRQTEVPEVWTGDGANWSRTQLPPAFDGIPSMAAAGPTGVIVVGHRPTLRGDNPIVWHRTPDGRWVPETRPMLPVVPDPSRAACSPLPTDFAEFTVVDTAAAVVCHGDESTTMRAWSQRCDGCYGGNASDASPAWLARPSANLLFLWPVATADGNSQSVVVDPSLYIDPAWYGLWLDVTGHFDDPASASCHVTPTIDDLPWWSGQRSVIDQCRETFVVTAVKVASRQ